MSRRDEIIRAAFDLIAEVGIEGLRTREVAARVGINIATLHYHFPAKQDLIEAVTGFVAMSFYNQHADWPGAAEGQPLSSLERLRQEFRDTRALIETRPELLIVLRELMLLARRDAEVAQIVDPLVAAWRGGLVECLADGVADGTFRAGLDIDAAADLLVSAQWGAANLFASDLATIERIGAEIEHYFVNVKSDLERRTDDDRQSRP